MIHSLSGGVIKQNKNYSIAKIEVIEGVFKGNIYFYINQIENLKLNDSVLIPFGKNDTLLKGKVLRIDENVNEQNLPFPLSKMKEIFKKLD